MFASNKILRASKAAIAFCTFLLAGSGSANSAPTAFNGADQNVCLIAAQKAANEHDVPVSVLTAVALTETGRKKNGILSPWPWATNVEGQGRWFDTRDLAEKFILAQYSRGTKNFDVGCFQINYRWHGYKFGAPTALFDPFLSADYAAKFLRDLFEESGDWSVAAGAYHSRTPKFAQRYRKRFDKMRAARLHLDDLPGQQPAVGGGIAPEKVALQNNFPLLIKGSPGTAGSLFSVGTKTRVAALPVGTRRGLLWDD